MKLPFLASQALLLALVSCSTSSTPATTPASGTSTGPATETPSETPMKTPPATEKTSGQAAEKGADAGPLATMRRFIEERGIDKTNPRWKTTLARPPQLTFEAGKTYLWKLETSEGPITVKLLPDVAPMHVSSTIYLTELGFYDDLKFHRIIPGFMAQGGCPLGMGSGSPGYSYDGEFSPTVRHTKPGLLSMANRGPGTDGSQFFLTFVPTPHLDGKHTIFGEVTDGMDVLPKLAAKGSGGGQTSSPVLMTKATIVVE